MNATNALNITNSLNITGALNLIVDTTANAIPYLKSAANTVGPYADQAFNTTKAFIGDHIDDLNDRLPVDITNKISKEWAETLPLGLLACGAAIATYKAVKADYNVLKGCFKAVGKMTSKVIVATVWTTASVVAISALSMAIMQTHIGQK